MALDEILKQMKDEEQQTTALSNSALQSYKVSPDQVAGNMKLARKTGLPVHVLPELSDDAKLQALTDSLHQAMETAPATARFLSNPENAQVAHDDVDQLSTMERVFSPFLGFGAKLMAGLASNEAVGTKAIDILTQGRRLLHEDHGAGRFQKSLEQYANDQTDQVAANVKYWDDLAKRYGEDDTLTGRLVGGLVKAVAGLPAGIVGFHPVFGGLSAAAETAKAPGSDGLQVLTSGVGEAVKLKGLGKIFHAVQETGLGTVGKMGLTSAVMGTQTAAELAGSHGPGMLATPQGMEEVLSSLVTGAALGYSGMSGEQEVIRKRLLDAGVDPADAYKVAAAAPILKPVINDQAKSQEALVTRDFFNALGEAAGESKLLQRLPEKLREYVQELKKDGPVDNVFVPADAWATYWQDAKEDPERVAEMVTGDREQYQEALRTGGDLVIPLEDFISKLAGTEHYKGLADDVKLRPGAMSAREAEAFREGYPDALEELRGKIEDGEAVDAKERTSFQKVYDDVFGQLQGIFPRDTAERYATLTAVRARTRAARLGRDAFELYQEAPLKIVQPLPEALRVKTVDTGLDPLLDRLRSADIPADDSIFGSSLLQFLRDKGLQDQGGELKAKDLNKATRQPGKKNLMREDGLPLDKAREAAVEAGYLKEGATVRDFLDAMDGELRGNPVYSTRPANERAFDLKQTLDELQGELDRRGIDLAQMSNEEVRRQLFQGEGGVQLYQGGKEPRLAVTHNLTSENLIEADKIGGLAVPSLAVTPEHVGHESYGDISLIGREHLGNPEKEPVLDSDAYTARFPHPEYPKVTTKVAQKVVDEFRPYGQKYGESYLIDAIWDNSVNFPNPAKILEEISRYSGVKAKFLHDVLGKKVDPVMAPVPRDVEWSGTKAWRDFVKSADWEADNLAPGDPKRLQLYKDATVAGRKAIAEYLDGLRNKDGEPLSDEFKAKMAKSYEGRRTFGEDGELLYNVLDRARRDVHEKDGKQAADKVATAQAVDQALAGHEGEFKTWLDGKILGMFKEPFLKVGGKKLPYTLESIVQHMTSQKLRGGEKGMTFGAGAARAMASHQFADLEKMREAAAENIIPKGELEEHRKKTEALLEDYRTKVAESYTGTDWRGKIDYWNAFDDSMKAIARWAKGARTEANLKAALSKEGFKNVPAEVLSLGVEAGKAMLMAPVPYFEAKPQRAVKLSEFAGAVVPSDVSPEVRQVLEKHGLTVKEYGNRFDEEARHKAAAELRTELQAKGERVLFQPGEGDGPNGWGSVEGGGNNITGTQRGFIRFAADHRLIGILEKADLSTYLHESGHQWLEELRADALRPDAPDQVKTDWQTAKEKLGIKDLPDDAPIPREAHEEWAQQAEAYLSEGKAPSAELSGLFGRFKLWLSQVYRTLKGLNVNLTDEVRGVMDRLLATDEEIRTAAEEAGQRPLFATAEDAGMTAKEFEAYRKDAEAGGAHARDVLAGKLMRELKREQEKWWKDEKDKVRQEVLEEVKQNPVYAALQEVLKGKDFEGNETPGLKMDKATLVDMYGEEFIKRLPKGSATEYLYTSEGGVHPDLLAERYGFGSGDEMIRKMLEAPNLKRFVAAEADLRMKERHGDMRLDGSIADQALAAVHNDHWAEVMRAEIKALKKKAKEVGPYVKAATKEATERGKKDAQATARWRDAEARLKEAETRKAHKEELDQLRKEAKAAEREAKSQGKADADATARWYGAERATEAEKARQGRLAMAEKIPPVKTFREAARQQIGDKPVRELTPQLYLSAEQKAAREAFQAAAKGDYEKAAEARTRQLLNHFLYFEASKAKEEADTIRKYAVKMGSTAELGKLGKAGQDYLLQMKAILNRYEFVKVSLVELDARKETLQQFLDRLKDEDNLDLPIPPDIVDEMQKPVNYRELTVDELRSVYDALRMIEHAAKTVNTVMADAVKVQLGDAALRLTMRLQSSIPEKGGRGAVNDSSLSWLEKLKEHAGELDIPVLRPEFLMERMDGGTSGAWHDFFWNRYNEASAHQNRLREKVFPDILELTRSGIDRSQKKVYIESLRGSLSKDDIIAIALNAGNESNRDKLQRGGVRFPHEDLARPLTDEALQEILSHLSKDDIKVVNGIWKAIEKLRPDAAELAKKRTGIEPKWIEASPLEVKNGTLEGGYFPLKYDARWSAAGEKQADASTLDQLFTRYAPASTRQGYMKERTEFAAPLSLDWQAITSRHLDEVITDISHWEFASQAQKLLKRGDVKETIIDRMGMSTYKNLLDWVRYTVNQDTMGREASDTLEKLRRSIRTKASTYILGFKVQNAIADALVGMPLALQRLEVVNVYRGTLEYLRNPKAVHRFSSATSEYMRSLDLEMDRNLTEALQDLAGKHTMMDDVRRWAIESRVWAYKVGANAAWISGYREAQAKNLDGKEAARYADKVVRMTQDAGRAGDLSAVERNPNMKELTMYIGPTLIQYNNNASAVRKIADQGFNRYTATNAAKVLVFGYIANAVLYEMLRGRQPDDHEKIPAWLLARLSLGWLDGIPIGRDIAAYAEGKITGEPGKSMRHIPVLEAGKTAVDAIDALYKAGTGEGEPRRAVTTSAKAVGAWTGLPALQGTITGEFLYDVLTGQYEPEHPWSPVTDIFNRRKNHNGGGPR